MSQTVLDIISSKPVENKAKKLTQKQLRYIECLIICGEPRKAALQAGYNPTRIDTTLKTLSCNSVVQAEIQRRNAETRSATILSATQLLELYTKIANGEVLDQFGLDASLKDRIAAMKELAKYQIELPMKLAEKQQQDNQLTIKLIRDK